jgi:hypothetical protein
MKGNIIDDIKDSSYNTFKINIMNTKTDNIDSTMKINSSKKIYIIDVDEGDVDVKTDDSIADKINLISGVTADGLMSNENINVITSSTSKKQKYIKVFNNNFAHLKQLKADAEASSVIIEILLADIDTTVFTPNKEYNIVNRAINKNIDGKYSLASKKEVFILGPDHFVVNTLLTLRKVP